jgi:7-cyano-7-deazaguanine synthase
MHSTALVLFSGGQDSSVCLAYALKHCDRVETIGFNYGQRHGVEMTVRPTLLAELRSKFPHWTPKLGPDHVLDLSVLSQISDTALTSDTAFSLQANGLPNTFVPGRNLLFLNFAAALAYRRGLRMLVTGVCETDFSGYPDCRDDTMKSLQVTLNLGLGTNSSNRLLIETPLMWIDKTATWAMAQELGGQPLIDIIIEHSHTCYAGDRSQRHAWGYGCAACPACDLRAKGWQKFLAA